MSVNSLRRNYSGWNSRDHYQLVSSIIILFYMKAPIISIISPVYNVGKYLSTFIESVLAQTFSDWELLLIDDGSTDESGKICDDYAQRDNRIQVVHKENGGVSYARNTGIKMVRGEWILMPDPDDVLPQDSVESMYRCISNNIDLVSGSYIQYTDGVLNPEKATPESKEVPLNEYVEEIGKISGIRFEARRCCNKLFKTSIIRSYNIFFHEEIAYREDILYVYQYLSHCKKNVYCLNKPIYIYYRRPSGAAISLAQQYRPKSKTRFYAHVLIYQYGVKMNISKEAKERLRKELLQSYFIVCSLIRKSNGPANDILEIRKELLNYYSNKELKMIKLKNYRRLLFNKLRKLFHK